MHLLQLHLLQLHLLQLRRLLLLLRNRTIFVPPVEEKKLFFFHSFQCVVIRAPDWIPVAITALS
jgi:hypothetical protein